MRREGIKKCVCFILLNLLIDNIQVDAEYLNNCLHGSYDCSGRSQTLDGIALGCAVRHSICCRYGNGYLKDERSYHGEVQQQVIHGNGLGDERQSMDAVGCSSSSDEKNSMKENVRCQVDEFRLVIVQLAVHRKEEERDTDDTADDQQYRSEEAAMRLQ